MAIILISCSVTPKGASFVGRNREYLQIEKGNPTTITDTTIGQIYNYWTRNRFRKKIDVVKIQSFYLDKKGSIYKYSTAVNRFNTTSLK